MATLGKRNLLSIVRASAPGLYLDGGELGEILLPGRYIPPNLKPKDHLDVFAPLTEQIIKELEQSGGKLAFDDDSSPESIRQKFSVSKKAFKQALGKLYKARRIQFQKPGVQLLEISSWSPDK